MRSIDIIIKEHNERNASRQAELDRALAEVGARLEKLGIIKKEECN